MSLQDFWTNVRLAASLLSPVAIADSPKLDATRIERILRNADLWLTPKAVEGFDESDFAFLSDEDRRKLTDAVNGFLDVARHVPPNAPATQDQVHRARPHFITILQILRPDKYSDVNALVIGKRLERKLASNLPEWVRDLRIDAGVDANGDPSIWIWVEVSDDAAKSEVLAQNTRIIRERVEAAVRQLNTGYWPYVRFRTVSEQNVDEGGRRR
jgi:hypothetical protein